MTAAKRPQVARAISPEQPDGNAWLRVEGLDNCLSGDWKFSIGNEYSCHFLLIYQKGIAYMAIGRIFHTIPMSDNLPALKSTRYNNVFSVRRDFQDGTDTPGDKGDASKAPLGNTVVQLSKRNIGDSLVASYARQRSDLHAAAFRVQHFDATQAYPDTKGMMVLDRDEYTLITDPATKHGGLFRWITWNVPGGTRDASVLETRS